MNRCLLVSSDGGRGNVLSVVTVLLLFRMSVRVYSESGEYVFQLYEEWKGPIDIIEETVVCVRLR